MSLFVPLRQIALHIPNTGPKGQGHLFVILTNCCPDGRHLLVPICSVRHPGHDRTCLLGVGDHKFLRQPSFVEYANADIYRADVLIKRVNDNTMGYEGPVEDRVFALICTGLTQSRHVVPRMLVYYQNNSG